MQGGVHVGTPDEYTTKNIFLKITKKKLKQHKISWESIKKKYVELR